MSRIGLLSLICLAVSLSVFVTATNARVDLQIDENTTTISFQQLAPTVFLSIENKSGKPVSGVAHVELLKPSNEAIGATQVPVSIASGKQQLRIVLPVKSPDLLPAREPNILWYRLHYRLLPSDSGATAVEGFISLSRITPDLFELRVTTPGAVGSGMRYHARVRAVHPTTDQPAKGVAIKGSVEISDETDVVLSDSATTNGDGYADLHFQLPANLLSDELELSVEGRRGLLAVTARQEIDLEMRPRILVSTDKPIYQPGQTLYTRGLVIGPTRHALSNKEVQLEIKDADDNTAFSADLQTSRFGIANTEWKIPEHIKLGEYHLTFSLEDTELASATVNISRYELPNFVVNVKTDRPYYLQGQDATVTVRGDYLFGEPVKRGRVRVVHAKEQRWNAAERRYEGQGQNFDGELGSDSTFVVHVPLVEELKSLLSEDRRFRDLNFIAYLTDASTNRTEQRRFNLRISREAIHIYAIRPGDRYRESAGLPLTIYVATSYADGTPARCNVTVANDATKDKHVVAQVKTNRYGLAKIVQRAASLADNTAVTLSFTAQDSNGNNGKQAETFNFDSEPGVAITTPKTIFAPGESIPATIVTTDRTATVTLSVVRNWSVLHSQSVHVSGGRASVLVTYKPEFKQEIVLVAYADGAEEESHLIASRSVMYPRPRDLKLKLRADAEVYRPGDQARVSFKSATSEGRTVESALGVVVVDKAVEERSRADLEPHRYYASFLDEALEVIGQLDSLGAINRNALENLDISRPVPPDLDLAAEIFLNKYAGYFPEFFRSEVYEKDLKTLFARHTFDQLQPFRAILNKTYEETGAYPRDEIALRQLLSNRGGSLDSLRDPWGTAYRPVFYVERNTDVFTFESAGPDKRFDTDDDFRTGRMVWQYFRRVGEAINNAVQSFYQRTGKTISDFKTLRYEVLSSGIDLETLKDPWDKPYVFNFEVTTTGININVATNEGSSSGQTFSVWLTRFELPLKSSMAALTRSTRSVREEPKESRPIVVSIIPGSTGGITGTVFDPNGAVVPGATVTAVRSETNQEVASVKTDDNGRYLLRNLPPGLYGLRVEAVGFVLTSWTDIRVRASEVLELNVTLQVGAVTETVSIVGESAPVLSTDQSVAEVKRSKDLRVNSASSSTKPIQQFFTPRVREFFPETLVWNPQLTTDSKGRAQLDFKLADNITTWKLSVIGSTEDGEIGVAETEIRTFQPFFAELDPPQILTQGDQISLPVVLRNYLNAKQKVDVKLKPEDWFTILSPPGKQTEVAARESSTEVFSIEATSMITDGRQQVTAIGSEFSDAIEKRITVHPDGEEKTTTASGLLTESTTLTVSLPTDTFNNSAHLEVKVYPNLISHVWESVEGIMQRPHGCGEQTISSTYPSLLVLKNLEQQNEGGPLAQKARRYVEAGYERLRGYQSADGGFSYWGHGDSDVALTAYAIRFLFAAGDLIDVDSDVVSRARSWLTQQQRPDGSWGSHSSGENDRMLTAFVVRSLSLISPCKKDDADRRTERVPIEKGLKYLESDNARDDAYILASYSLSASLSCEPARAVAANTRLQKMAQVTAQGTSWPLQTNTPFYGWGRTGQIETTALVVQALTRQKTDSTVDALINGALLYLLREKDRYGVWYSSQATINVLDSLLMLLPAQAATQQTGNDKLDVFVNNQKFDSIELPTRQQMLAPLLLDVSSALRVGENKIEFKRSSSGTVASVQAVGTYWIPWKSSLTAKTTSDAKGLRLQTSCDQNEVRVMEQIKCHVAVERAGGHGGGMLLAEIGLPPGAEVDRSSLDAAMKASGWVINQYDVLPDRIVVYLWPGFGRAEFAFSFRPRMAMNAQSAASVLYDYYNPDARATVVPARFVVK